VAADHHVAVVQSVSEVTRGVAQRMAEYGAAIRLAVDRIRTLMNASGGSPASGVGTRRRSTPRPESGNRPPWAVFCHLVPFGLAPPHEHRPFGRAADGSSQHADDSPAAEHPHAVRDGGEVSEGRGR